MDQMQTIIQREFEKASGMTVTEVEFTDDERIIVTTTSAATYVMEIGSDDDLFAFRHGDDIVTFPYPADWWVAL
jgi:hypothetical protein